MTPPPDRLRLLICDDDAMIREALRDVLEAEPDLDVVAVAKDTDEAITLAEHHQPTVAVLDIRMPGGGGSRAAREIQDRSPRTEILAFSAYDDTDAMEQMRLLGVTDYLIKGTPNNEILTAIRRLGRRAIRPDD
jgi:DNA-binding NarL/FixJ family response regulator